MTTTASPPHTSAPPLEAHRTAPDDRLARGLGWTSVLLGVPQLVRPAAVVRAVGVADGPAQRALARTVGARELLHAAGLLGPGGVRWAWTRVAGDAMDLATLTRALQRQKRRRGRTLAATAAVAGITAVDVYAAVRSRRTARAGQGVELTAATTVTLPPRDVYDFWRRLDNLPGFMAHLEQVTVHDPMRSRWRASAPFGRSVEWEAEVVEDVPGERLAWRSLDGSDVRTSGVVEFRPAPGARGTEVHVTLRYDVGGGRLGRALARWAGEDPRQQLDDDLRRCKQVLETGEVVRSDGAPGGKHARREFPQHPAQPLTPAELTDIERAEVRA